MEVSYKRDFHHSYLIIQDEKLPDCDTYPVKMLLNGAVPGLLTCQIHRVDNQALFYYEITSKQPLSVLYESKKLDRDSMILIISALIKTMEEMERYLLDPSCLLLQPEYIYINTADREVGFCCWPRSHQETDHQAFLHFTEYLLPQIDHQDQEAVILGYQLYRRAMEGRLDPEEIRGEIYREMIKPQKTEEANIPEEAALDPAFMEEESRKREEVLETLLQDQGEGKKENSGKIMLCITGIGLVGIMCFYLIWNHFFSWQVYCAAGTVLFLVILGIVVAWKVKKRKADRKKREDPKAEVRLVNTMAAEEPMDEKDLPDIREDLKTSLLNQPTDEEDYGVLQAVHPPRMPDIVLKKGTVILGKMEGAVDIVLPSPAVSRVHAKVCCDKECEIFDLNSRNGTYVNQTEGVGYEGKKLKDGDRVSFADVVFCYHSPEKNGGLHIHRE
ncbi:MAG: DUF6382 domain-containing protein [Ruminococcus sp.]|jgi:hypothetical protein